MELGDASLLEFIEYRSAKNLYLTHSEIEDRVKQIIMGLYYLVAKCKILHRDIKPGNILLFDNNTILKLADMGCVKILNVH